MATEQPRRSHGFRRLAGAAGLLTVLVTAAVVPGAVGAQEPEASWTDTFNLEGCDWASTGSHPFFVLEPGHQLLLEGEEDGETLELTITVLDETEVVDGVETRVVEEREVVGGELVEVSRNFYAVCAPHNSVFYFGEDVEDYEDGEVVANEGAWRAGEDGAQLGLIMPGLPLLGARYYQELAPDVALDRAEIVSLTAVVETPAGTFEECLETEETNPLEAGGAETKAYAPGIGLVQDAEARLVRAVGPTGTPIAG